MIFNFLKKLPKILGKRDWHKFNFVRKNDWHKKCIILYISIVISYTIFPILYGQPVNLTFLKKNAILYGSKQMRCDKNCPACKYSILKWKLEKVYECLIEKEKPRELGILEKIGNYILGLN